MASTQNSIGQLAYAIGQLNHSKDVTNFLYDIATPQEINTLAQRLEIAKLLWTTDWSYLKIAKQVSTSTTTVTRVARFLYKEKFGGYRQVLTLLYPK